MFYLEITKCRWARKDATSGLLIYFCISDANAPYKLKWRLITTVPHLCESNKMYAFRLFQLMKLSKKILGETLFTKMMKATFYGHFVAGEDEVQITPVLERLRQFGVKPILDYSVEEDISQEEAERRELQYVPLSHP